MPSSHSISSGSADSLYRQIFDGSKHFALIGISCDGKVTAWSRGAEHVLGWSEEEMLDQPLHRFFTAEDVANQVPENEMQRAVTEGYATDERWHRRKNGDCFWAVGEMTPLRATDGTLTGFSKVVGNRTAQKTAQTRLEALTATLEGRVAERTRERDRMWRNSQDLLMVIDHDGILQSINPAATVLLDYQPEELIGQHFQPFVHPDDIGACFDALARAAQGPVANFEVRLHHKTGGYRHVVWTSVSESGLIYANGRDITTEKRQAEMLRAQTQSRLRMALEAGQMGVWKWDMQSDEVLLLDGADLLHGFPPSEEPIRFPSMAAYLELVHPDDRRQVAKVASEALARGRDHHAEYRILWPDGRTQWLEARGTVTLAEDGTTRQMNGVSINITRRKRSEQDLAFLARASAELAGLVDPQSTLDKLAHLAVPLFADWCAVDLLIDDDKLERVAVAHVDPHKVQLAHALHRRYPPNPDMACGVWQVVRSGKASLVSEIGADMLATASSDPEHLAAIRELGLRSSLCVPLRIHGKVLGAITFISAETGRIYHPEDLSLACDLAARAAVAIENARLYLTLQQADRDKDVFMATLAHELRNPLAAISNGVSILQLAVDAPPQVKHSTDIMARQLDQLSRLVDDLLDIARITTGKVELRKERVDLTGILNQAIEASRPLIDTAHHKLVLAVTSEAAQVCADSMRLTQVFANLLSNAAKYTDPGGRIEIRLECTPADCIVSVRDNGIGIEAAALPRIFTMFSQVRHPLQRIHGGLGIGLSLVERLVRMHGGSVRATSEGIGKGSEFTVRLPRDIGAAATEGNREQRPETDQAWWSARRVLVVDDNQDAAGTIAEVLRMLGSEVDTAHDGLAAVEAAQTLRPDLVLLDIGLPGIDGYEAARRIRAGESGKRALLIALTGWGQEQDRQQALQAGFDLHWVKPVRLEQLQSLANAGPALLRAS